MEAESVFIAAEWYGSSCMTSNSHPKDPKVNYPLYLTQGTGCAIDTDPMSVKADSQESDKFIKDNGDLLPNALTLPNFLGQQLDKTNFYVNLMNRQRILTKESPLCDKFRFEPQTT